MRYHVHRITVCLLALIMGSIVVAADKTEEKEEKKDKIGKMDRVIELKKDDPVPTDFQHRVGIQGIIRTIKKFKKKMPKTHTAKIYIERVQNMNYGKNDDVIRDMVMLNPEGEKDGEEWVFAGGAESNRLKQKIPWKDGVKDGIEKVYGRGRGHYLKKERPWDNGEVKGVVKVYYPNGKIMSKIPFKDGKQHGKSKTYSRKGKLIQVVPYKKGKREGTMIEYWPKTGKKKKVVPCKDDKVNGEVRMYYENGQIKRKMHFKEDSLHGVVVEYNEKGEVETKRYWLNGTPVAKGVYESKKKNK